MKIVIKIILGIVFVAFVAFCLFMVFMVCGGAAQASVIKANDCTVESIQAACDQVEAEGGGTVYVPAGTCVHSGYLKLSDGIHLIGAGIGQTVITNANIKIIPMYYGSLGLPARLSGMTLDGNSKVEMRGCEGFRIDHIEITSASGTAISVTECSASLIDHCTVNLTGNLYGVAVSKGYNSIDWEPDVSTLWGQSTAIFIEDCTFNGNGHGTIGHGNAHYVVRHCVFNDSVAHVVDAHGPGYGPPCGTRLVECYDNLFQNPVYTWKAVGIRGGAAIIYNNTFTDYDNAIGLHLETNAQNYDPKFQVADTYIWSNTYNGACPQPGEVSCENGVQTDSHCCQILVWNIGVHPGLESCQEIIEGQEYFRYAPTGYVPYVYPHPLTGGIPQDTPTPEPEDTATPVPTVTPENTATETPMPIATNTQTPYPVATETPIPTVTATPVTTVLLLTGGTINLDGIHVAEDEMVTITIESGGKAYTFTFVNDKTALLIPVLKVIYEK